MEMNIQILMHLMNFLKKNKVFLENCKSRLQGNKERSTEIKKSVDLFSSPVTPTKRPSQREGFSVAAG